MKFSVSKKVLHVALGRVMPAVPAKTTILILENVLFELEGHALRLTTTDVEHTIVTALQVEGQKDGACAVPAKKLYDLVKSLPDGELSFAISGKRLAVKTANGEYKLSCEDVDEFPTVNEYDVLAEFSYDAPALLHRFETVAFAASTDELRTTLMGVLCDLHENKINFVATNGHVFAMVSDTQFTSDQKLQAIIPSKCVRMLLQNLGDAEKVEIALGKEGASFKFGETKIHTRTIAGIYPNYGKVLPRGYTLAVKNIDAAELTSALHRAKIFAHEITGRVSVTISPGVWRVDAEQESGNTAKEQFSVQYDESSEAVTIGCNVDYMLAVIKHLRAERINFLFQDPNSAMLFVPAEEQEGMETMMVLMPIKLD